MKLRTITSLLGVVALSALLCSPAAAAVIFADNFNTPAFPTGTSIISYAGGGFLGTTPSTAPGVFGWFVGGAGVDHVDITTGDIGADGDAWIDLNALDQGSLELAIVGAFTPGSEYTLLFFGNAANGTGAGIDVEISNGYAVTGFTPSVLATDTATFASTTNPVTQGSWTPYAVNFTADVTGNIVVKFGSNVTGPAGAYLDQVIILDAETGGEVPEPTTLLLAGAGLLGMAWLRRRA